MHTNKGYILPVVSICVLLVLAGFFLFGQKKVESPQIETPVIPQSVTPTQVDEQSASTTATSTNTNLLDDVQDVLESAIMTSTSTTQIEIQ